MKKKCLLILPRQIHPQIGGYAMKNNRLVELLNRHFDLTVIIISSQKITAEETNFFKQNTFQYEYITISKWKYLIRTFFALFSTIPLQVGYFYNKKVQKSINLYLPTTDVAIGALVRTMKYLEKCPENCAIVFDMVDSIGLNYQRSQKNVKSSFWKIIYSIETKRLLKYEQKWVEKADITYLFNADEAQYWSKYGCVQLLPHGVNEKLFDYSKQNTNYPSSVAFIGKMDYQPNVDAVLWYTKNVHPLIGHKVRLVIVGAYPTDEVKALAENNNNITVTGFVDDPFEILKSTNAVIAPMQTGGGIQNKVLEAMALGTINILTPLAAQPIQGAKNGQEFIIAQTPTEFAQKVIEVIESPDNYEIIKIQAKTFIKQNYTWQAYENMYVKDIETILENESTK